MLFRSTSAALALGGMSQGISPMEMAAAYGAFADQGTYRKPISYTKVLNRKGEVILKNKSKSHKAMDANKVLHNHKSTDAR